MQRQRRKITRHPRRNPKKSETPNEVITWKPSTKKKDKGEPRANTKPPKSSEMNGPEENPNTNKPKNGPVGIEGTGKDDAISSKLVYSRVNVNIGDASGVKGSGLNYALGKHGGVNKPKVAWDLESKDMFYIILESVDGESLEKGLFTLFK
ncbi:hypothetical protein [Paenibacillus silvae]|uniref:hypothetical protein n=1 Tax=Paenibacillus silvae TaxID=1325358 RepID=UPI0011A31B17|nr:MULTISPECIES: hypothetical protein [Paenibacillus]MCK6075304.1 hypothetical protein [Paenibacillus silvae]MCK6149691.1 hypothetical protein [Paenibacillus silvae]MCK6267989.1 hypothetical protein [Paenibacillus silvae]